LTQKPAGAIFDCKPARKYAKVKQGIFHTKKGEKSQNELHMEQLRKSNTCTIMLGTILALLEHMHYKACIIPTHEKSALYGRF
jgi:hypothetical protein